MKMIFIVACSLLLTVGCGGSDSDDDITPADNKKPVADAGEDFTTGVDVQFKLDGSGSFDSDGDTLLYTWSITNKPEGSTAPIEKSNEAIAYFTPDVTGQYHFSLQVEEHDNSENSGTDEVIVTVTSENLPPVAKVTPEEFNGVVGQAYSFDGQTSSDPNGNPLTYAWALQNKPDSSNSDISSSSEQVCTITPDVPGQYVIGLIVSDGQLESEPVTVVLTASEQNAPNSAPEISVTWDDGGSNPEVGKTINLDASQSTDRDGDPLLFYWELDNPNGSSAIITNDANKPLASFTPDVAGLYRVGVWSNDGKTDSEKRTVDFEVPEPVDPNNPPVARLSLESNDSPRVGDTITINGERSSDPDGDELTYNYSLNFPAESNATVSYSTDTKTGSFTPDVPGRYGVTLTVNDGNVDSEPVGRTIEVLEAVTPPRLLISEDFESYEENDWPNTWLSGANTQLVDTGSSVSVYPRGGDKYLQLNADADRNHIDGALKELASTADIYVSAAIACEANGIGPAGTTQAAIELWTSVYPGSEKRPLLIATVDGVIYGGKNPDNVVGHWEQQLRPGFHFVKIRYRRTQIQGNYRVLLTIWFDGGATPIEISEDISDYNVEQNMSVFAIRAYDGASGFDDIKVWEGPSETPPE